MHTYVNVNVIGIWRTCLGDFDCYGALLMSQLLLGDGGDVFVFDLLLLPMVQTVYADPRFEI